MKENSIEKTLENIQNVDLITLLRKFKKEGVENFIAISRNDFDEILSDYKRVLKENEILKEEKEQAWEEWNNLERGSYETKQKLKQQIKELQKENEELKSDNLEYQKIQDIFDKRTYRKKYLEERRKEEPNLLYPDADEIYRRYYELKKENQQLRNEYINIRQDAYIQGRAEEQQKAKQIIYKNYIPVQKIEKLIEELKQDDINMTRKYKGKKNITGELLGIDKVRVRAYREKTREINEKLHKLLSD